MDPISNADRIAALLQQKLRERARADPAGPKAKAGSSRPATALEAARALSAIEGIDERQRRRMFVQAILTEQFGTELVNDAQFQQLVARVSQAIEEDETSAMLLSELLTEMRRG